MFSKIVFMSPEEEQYVNIIVLMNFCLPDQKKSIVVFHLEGAKPNEYLIDFSDFDFNNGFT